MLAWSRGLTRKKFENFDKMPLSVVVRGIRRLIVDVRGSLSVGIENDENELTVSVDVRGGIYL